MQSPLASTRWHGGESCGRGKCGSSGGLFGGELAAVEDGQSLTMM